MEKITIVDYGMGNIESVVNAFQLLGVQCVVTDNPEVLQKAKAIVLPGVGAFCAAMRNLQKRGLDTALHEQVIQRKKPFMGICLGMQLIAKDSTELEFSKGLDWIDGHVLRLDKNNLPIRLSHKPDNSRDVSVSDATVLAEFPEEILDKNPALCGNRIGRKNKSFPVPHVGWNEVKTCRDSVLFQGIDDNAHFFFDHSYHLQCNSEIILATCDYGKSRVASIEKNHIFAVQFHPEKSQRNGLKLLRNFLNFSNSY